MIHLTLGEDTIGTSSLITFGVAFEPTGCAARRLIYGLALRDDVIEVELKYWSPGNAAIVASLNKLGAKKVSELTMEDVYFAHPSREFGKTDEAVRLRKTEEGAELTYKGPRMKTGTVKAREEITVKVADALSVQRILERVGFKEAYIVAKRRATYQLDKLRVDVDSVDGLGEFVELEAITESPDRVTALLEMARAELGLTRLEPKTYLELLIGSVK